MASRVQRGRLHKELQMMSSQPPPGVFIWPSNDSLTSLEAEMLGPPDSPYEGGFFKLVVTVPERYPFQPPNVRFVTPVYHPNIDTSGRICLDTLKMPPKGAWVPSLNLASVMTTVRLLLGSPNPDDGLMPDITAVYKCDRASFLATARAWTKRHASASSSHSQEKQGTAGACSTSDTGLASGVTTRAAAGSGFGDVAANSSGSEDSSSSHGDDDDEDDDGSSSSSDSDSDSSDSSSSEES